MEKKNKNKIYDFLIISYVISLFTVAYHDVYYLLNRIVFVFLICAFFYKVLLLNRRIHIGRGAIYTLPFYIIIILSNLWAVNFNISLQRSIGISFYYFGALIVYISLHNKIIKENTIKIAFTISLIILTTTALYEYFVMDVPRAGGITQNANSFGLNVFVLSIFLLMYIKDKKYGKVKFIIVFLTILNAVVLSGSRKIIIAFVLLLLFVLISSLIKITLKNLMLFNFGIALGILVVFLNYSTISEYINNISGVERLLERDESLNIRESMVSVAVELFLQRPILGYGIDNFMYVSGFETYSHNNYTELLVSVGLVGIILYLMIYYNLLKTSLKTNNISIQMFTLFYVLVTLSLEFALVTVSSPRFWVLLLLLFGLNEKFILKGEYSVEKYSKNN